MRRREFITLLGGAAAWPMPVRAQQSAKRPTIGFMGTTTPSVWQPWTAAFVQRLRELGWIEDALRWKIPVTQRQRIQIVLLRESGMTQPAIAAAMGVSLSTVNRAHMAYEQGGRQGAQAQAEWRAQAREHDVGGRKGLARALCQSSRRRRDVMNSRRRMRIAM
jgi:Winged helix-turn helix